MKTKRGKEKKIMTTYPGVSGTPSDGRSEPPMRERKPAKSGTPAVFDPFDTPLNPNKSFIKGKTCPECGGSGKDFFGPSGEIWNKDCTGCNGSGKEREAGE